MCEFKLNPSRILLTVVLISDPLIHSFAETYLLRHFNTLLVSVDSVLENQRVAATDDGRPSFNCLEVGTTRVPPITEFQRRKLNIILCLMMFSVSFCRETWGRTLHQLSRVCLALESSLHKALGHSRTVLLTRISESNQVRACTFLLFSVELVLCFGTTLHSRAGGREMAMATTTGMLSSKAHLHEDRPCISSRIGHSGAGKNRVSFANCHGTFTQWARIVYRGQCRPLQIAATGEKAVETTEEKEESVEKTEEYSASMQQAMGTSLTYRHELGINYAYVLPDLIVGSCLQTPADADKLRDAGVGVVFCLQQDPDLAYFGVDLPAIQARVNELDGITHYRCQIRDFDPFDLRMRLPVAVAQLHKAIEANKGTTAYVHCTAGLGRAPGVALAYMYWIRGLSLKEANALLQKVRTCHPKLESIRAATADLLTEGSKQDIELKWPGGPESVEIAGLDVGWGSERIPMEYDESENLWILRQKVPVGRYEYKYVVDGDWTTDAELPLSEPNREGQVNNVIEVTDSTQNGTTKKLRERLMQEDADLTSEERTIIRAKLEDIANSGQW